MSSHCLQSDDNGGVVSILNNRVLSMCGIAVVGVLCEQEGAEHTAMGGLRCSTPRWRRGDLYKYNTNITLFTELKKKIEAQLKLFF